MTTSPGISRRKALTGAAAAGVAVPFLAACGDDGDGGDQTATEDSQTPNTGESTPGNGNSSAPAAGLAATSDIEVGGGKIFGDENVVITQPTAGEFKGFSATCTHQGCIFSSVEDGNIVCGCHGSMFSVEDGTNTGGPNGTEAGSVADLEEVTLTVNGDQISVS
ncbi:Rieske (2Fe-2S) protein [Nocardioides speluncae]|uniref:Rieske (2Fe-2S) protein n=1 Tax=Nocardioides speluncae TaxID=2670337 RepID=UPI001F0C9240|nr:Rieske (2Fe-2S) protein [Nocardioides speluncae]